MSFEKAKADLEKKGLGDHVIVLNESSATVTEEVTAPPAPCCITFPPLASACAA